MRLLTLTVHCATFDLHFDMTDTAKSDISHKCYASADLGLNLTTCNVTTVPVWQPNNRHLGLLLFTIAILQGFYLG